MRIGGIASGMDTEQMIRDLMKVERVRVDRLLQQEQRTKWKQEAYNDINRKMANFILNTRKAFSGNERAITRGTVERFDWVKKAISSNESIVKATATTGAMNGTHKIEVVSLAEVARVSSKKLGSLIEDGKFNSSGTFKLETAVGETEIKINGSVVGKDFTKFDYTQDNLTFSINGHIIKLDEDYEDRSGVVDAIQTQLNESFTNLGFDEHDSRRISVKLSTDGTKLSFESKIDINITESAVGNVSDLGLNSGVTRVNNTIQSLLDQLNNAVNSEGKSLGIRAAYDSSLDQIMISTKSSGKDEFIKFTNVAGIDVGTIFSGDSVTKLEGQQGKNSVIKFNGEETAIERPTNNFSLYGINFQLISAQPGTEITINVDANTDGIYNKVQEFVKSYNEMIDEINGLTGQKIFRDFLPLTEEQKKAMSEDDIKRWEEKSKSGLLRQDEGLTRILQSMRSSLYNQVQGTIGQFNHITSLGITTGTYQDGGKLVINEERLKAAISNDPEGVVNLLFKTSDTVVPTSGSQEEIRAARQKQANESGLIQRIYNDMITGMKDIIRRSGTSTDASLFRTVQSNMLIDFVTANSSISVIDKDLSDINKRIAREEQIIAGREDRYWKQFAAMEKAMNQMQQQGNWLMSQLGMGQ